MNKLYDAIVIGAGNGGLVAACTLHQTGKSVLLVESQNSPGGCSNALIKGRFEFDSSLQQVCDYGNIIDSGNLRELFARLGIIDKLEFVDAKEAFRVINVDDLNEDYILPFGIDDFINKIETYVPGNLDVMNDFFELCHECRDAMDYINSIEGNLDISVLKSKYPSFMSVAPYSLKDVLNKLNISKKVQDIISSCWFYLGASASDISFVHYAIMFYNYITLKAQVPVLGSYDITLTLEDQFRKMGGEIRYSTSAMEILVENNEVTGVKLSDDEVYGCKHIICNMSPHNVYGKLINYEKVPKQANKLCNQRVFGGRGFNIYLGLNKSKEELGITNYNYFLYHSLDSDEAIKKMMDLDNDSCVVTCVNNALDKCSFKGTTILCFKAMYFSDCFDKEVSEVNYYNLKEQLALKYIENFERTLGIELKDSIEEIEILSPVDFAYLTNSPQGVVSGYYASKNDNLIPRMLGLYNEDYINGLRFCGAFSYRLSTMSASYLSGEMAANMTLKDMKGGSNK